VEQGAELALHEVGAHALPGGAEHCYGVGFRPGSNRQGGSGLVLDPDPFPGPAQGGGTWKGGDKLKGVCQ
jgi:hypothetical protein